MKAYVIKRDDGKYLSKYFNYDYRLNKPQKRAFTKNIYNAQMFTSKPYVDCLILKYKIEENCETIKVLIEIKECEDG